MSSPNTYLLTFSNDNRNWSLTINGNPVVTNQTTMMIKPYIAYLFARNGYGEVMPDGHTYCQTDATYEASFEVFTEIARNLRRN